jgi:hemerythrin-like metal-binding protein
MSTNNALFGRLQLQHHSVSNLIQWGEHLSVEHPEIDAQHRAIFDLGTRVYENWRGGAKVDALRPAVDKLANLLPAHCAFEERLLADIGYEDLDQHKAEHRRMLDELAAMRERVHAFADDHEPHGGSLLAPGWPVMQFILGFTVGHVMSSDMAYCRTLLASNARA